MISFLYFLFPLLFLFCAWPWYKGFRLANSTLKEASAVLLRKDRKNVGSRSHRYLDYTRYCSETPYYHIATEGVLAHFSYFYFGLFRLENGEERMLQLPRPAFLQLKEGQQATLLFQRDVVRACRQGTFSYKAPARRKSSILVEGVFLLLVFMLLSGATIVQVQKQSAWNAQLSSGITFSPFSTYGLGELADALGLPSLAQGRMKSGSYNLEESLCLALQVELPREAVPQLLEEAREKYPQQEWSGAAQEAPDYYFAPSLRAPSVPFSPGEIRVYYRKDGSALIKMQEAFLSKKTLRLLQREAGYALF